MAWGLDVVNWRLVNLDECRTIEMVRNELSEDERAATGHSEEYFIRAYTKANDPEDGMLAEGFGSIPESEPEVEPEAPVEGDSTPKRSRKKSPSKPKARRFYYTLGKCGTEQAARKAVRSILRQMYSGREGVML